MFDLMNKEAEEIKNLQSKKHDISTSTKKDVRDAFKNFVYIFDEFLKTAKSTTSNSCFMQKGNNIYLNNSGTCIYCRIDYKDFLMCSYFEEYSSERVYAIFKKVELPFRKTKLISIASFNTIWSESSYAVKTINYDYIYDLENIYSHMKETVIEYHKDELDKEVEKKEYIDLALTKISFD